MADLARFGNLIAARRLELGLSQADVGQVVGISPARVGHLERGRYKDWPAPEIFNGLALALQLPIAVLLRAAGANIPDRGTDEELEWVMSQLEPDHRATVVELAHAVLRGQLRQPRTAPPPPSGPA